MTFRVQNGRKDLASTDPHFDIEVAEDSADCILTFGSSREQGQPSDQVFDWKFVVSIPNLAMPRQILSTSVIQRESMTAPVCHDDHSLLKLGIIDLSDA
jgi:hypothetical protein